MGLGKGKDRMLWYFAFAIELASLQTRGGECLHRTEGAGAKAERTTEQFVGETASLGGSGGGGGGQAWGAAAEQ
eukprot:366249-Chlamydomonas_euryale.AAC.1